MRKIGVKKRMIGRPIIGRGHRCKTCSRPLRSGASEVCADCRDKGYVGNVIEELEEGLRQKVDKEVKSWLPKQS